MSLAPGSVTLLHFAAFYFLRSPHFSLQLLNTFPERHRHGPAPQAPPLPSADRARGPATAPSTPPPPKSETHRLRAQAASPLGLLLSPSSLGSPFQWKEIEEGGRSEKERGREGERGEQPLDGGSDELIQDPCAARRPCLLLPSCLFRVPSPL